MNPRFTIVTITYNSSKFVRQAIESVLAQSYTDFEYIISDDCSTDNTWEIIQEYKDPRIRSWRNEMNIGEYPNRNKTLSQAKGVYIYWLDGDDILYKNTLKEYDELISYFPEASGIWGVSQLGVDFVVFPYLFSPEEMTSLNFLSLYPITIFGFTESLFKKECLKNIGGLKISYMIGDTYIKRRLTCEYSILLIPAGKSFWRKTSNQASTRVKKNLRNLIESLTIDNEIINAKYFPLKGDQFELATKNFKNRRIKLIVKNTILKFRIITFFRIMQILKVPYYDFFLLFKKGDYSETLNANGANPLMNGYNYKKF